jgi:hypothetical protein
MNILKIGYESYTLPNLSDAMTVMHIMQDATKADYGYGSGTYTDTGEGIKLELFVQPIQKEKTPEVED